MATALLIMLREGFEAALIVAIVFAYLRRIDRLDLARSVWQGVLGAIGISLAVGIVVRAAIGNLEGDARLRAFAAVSLLAVVMLTWMVFWMRRQSRLIKGDLEHKVDGALAATDTRRALMVVAGVAVLREGIESALFLLAITSEAAPGRVLLGAVVGLAIAGALAYVVYWGGRSMPMKAFFTVTGIVLIVFAAGLVARVVLYLQGSGDLGSFNLNGVYDVRSQAWLTQETETGKFLAAMVGWDPRPSIEQVVAWLAYIVPVTALFLRPHGRQEDHLAEVAEATHVHPVGVGEPAEVSA
jgi:high-affinity iron transporter